MNDMMPTSGSDLSPMTGDDALATREKAVSMRAEAARTRLEIEHKQKEARAELERQRAELEAAFNQKQAELMEQMRPLQEQLKKIEEIVWTVDLYLGRDETIELLHDGEPAASDEPISVRQKVLSMAEESLVLLGESPRGMDAQDVQEFIDWLVESDDHLNRVLPEQKGVVVLVPTRVQAKTGDPFHDIMLNKANAQGYWIIRNGEQVYLLTTDPKLKINERVLPKRSEFEDVFTERIFGRNVEPGSDEWMKMEKRADALQRHYMRILMVLQGLIDRTEVWRPLPEGGTSFLRLEDQDSGRIRLIQDGDESIQLSDNRPSFQAYQKALNAKMRPGVRVICNFRSEGFFDHNMNSYRSYCDRNSRLYPENAEHPGSNVPYLIEGRKDDGYVIRYERTEKSIERRVTTPSMRPGYVHVHYEFDAPKNRASCLIKPTDDWVLCYDLATVEELEYYLSSRDNREKHFLSMVPVIRAALEAKKAEAEEEALFRALLRSMLEKESEEEITDALLGSLIHEWKNRNTWFRPLNGEPEHEAKAAKEIVADYKRLVSQRNDPMRERAIEVGKQVPNALAVACNKQGKWFVYSASENKHDQGVFMDITPIRKDGTLGTPKVDQIPAIRSVNALNVAWSAPEWDTWNFGANRNLYLTFAEREEAIADVLHMSEGEGVPLCIAEMIHRKKPVPDAMRMRLYMWTDPASPEDRAVVSGNPFQSNYGDSAPITSAVYTVSKDSNGVSVERTTGTMLRNFSQYHVENEWGLLAVPYDDSGKYTYEDRPHLIWADAQQMHTIASYEKKCIASMRRERDEKDALSRQANLWAVNVEKQAVSLLEAQDRQRFFEDYGDYAADLWEAHRKIARYDTRELSGLPSAVLRWWEHKGDIEGVSLQELSQWSQGESGAWGRWSLSEDSPFADLTLTAPELPQE